MTYDRFSVTVTNRPGKTDELHIGISKLLDGQAWGLEKVWYDYVFLSWLASLAAGKSAAFVYIQAAPPADA